MERVKVHEKICQELTNLFANKNSDYGGSFVNTRKEVYRAVVVRLMDKLERIKTITQNKVRVKDESLEDSLLDLANYCIMEVIEMRLDKQEELLGKEISDLESFIDNMAKETGQDKKEIIDTMIEYIKK